MLLPHIVSNGRYILIFGGVIVKEILTEILRISERADPATTCLT
jgi:hypothetical protein